MKIIAPWSSNATPPACFHARQPPGSSLGSAANVQRGQPDLQSHQREGTVVPTHKALLSKKIQKPVLRRDSFLEATSHDAVSVTAMAGH
jgi:hypothetical protein